MSGDDAKKTVLVVDDTPSNRDVKIAILSAFAFTQFREQAMAAGVDDFISKPFRAEEVFDCLARHLGVRYTYEAAVSEEARHPHASEALGAVPCELLKELASAVISLDSDRIAAAIACITEHNDELGRILWQHAEKFAYSAILETVQYSEAVRT